MIERKRRFCPEEGIFVYAEREKPNHILHLILAVLTAGFWIPVWFLIALSCALSPWRCPNCGAKTTSAFLAQLARR